MCQFFSLVSDGKGNVFYFNAKLRAKLQKEKPQNYVLDSHTSISHYFGFEGEREDKLNKYEYHPLLQKFQIDQINTTDDSEKVNLFCERLNFKKVVPQLIIKPIIHPFKDRNCTKVTKADLKLLKKWASVRDSVGDSVWDSVRASVRDSVWDSVWASVRDSVGASVGGSVGDSVWDSVRASVRDSVGDSVWDSFGAYISSFFNIKFKFDFNCSVKLWNKGLVPSFDGKVWRLHGKQGKILKEIKKEDL